MDLSLLPSFAHYSLVASTSNMSNYGGHHHPYPPGPTIDDYISSPRTSYSSPTSSYVFQHEDRTQLHSLATASFCFSDPYLVQSSLFKESTPEHAHEGLPDHNSYYYQLDSKLPHHSEWPHLTSLDNNNTSNSSVTMDGKLGLVTPVVSISTPPLTPLTPECKSNIYLNAASRNGADSEPQQFSLMKGLKGSFESCKGTIVSTDNDNYITITNANGTMRVKRRSANKKERRRTQSINSAFSNLRNSIPNVPADTKLSKIKTLRLATSYISYLMELLDGPRENTCKLLSEGFRADLSNSKRSSQQNRIETQNVSGSIHLEHKKSN